MNSKSDLMSKIKILLNKKDSVYVDQNPPVDLNVLWIKPDLVNNVLNMYLYANEEWILVCESINIDNISKDIIPKDAHMINLGSKEKPFASIHVDEAHLTANTLYMDEIPVIGIESENTVIKADSDKDIAIKTTGLGGTKVVSENNVEISTDGIGSNIDIKADGTSSRINLTSLEQINLSSPTINATGSFQSNNVVINENLLVKGNMIVEGSSTTIESTNMSVKDNIVEINSGEIGNGVSLGSAGLKINRGDNFPYMMIYDETDKKLKMGEQNNLKHIASETYVSQKIGEKFYSSLKEIDSTFTYNTHIKDVILAMKVNSVAMYEIPNGVDNCYPSNKSIIKINKVSNDRNFAICKNSLGEEWKTNYNIVDNQECEWIKYSNQEEIQDLLDLKAEKANPIFSGLLKISDKISLGNEEDGVFLSNDTSNKFLKLKDDGSISYGDNYLYHENNKPTTSDITGLDDILENLDLTVSWDDLENKPTSFTPNDHTHDVNEITGLNTTVAWSEITNKPESFTPIAHSHDISWNDLENKPTPNEIGTIKVYRSLTDINSAFTVDTAISDVIKAMFNPSMAIYNISSQGVYPYPYGTVKITKTGDDRNYAEFVPRNGKDIWITSYHVSENADCAWNKISGDSYNGIATTITQLSENGTYYIANGDSSFPYYYGMATVNMSSGEKFIHYQTSGDDQSTYTNVYRAGINKWGGWKEIITNNTGYVNTIRYEALDEEGLNNLTANGKYTVTTDGVTGLTDGWYNVDVTSHDAPGYTTQVLKRMAAGSAFNGDTYIRTEQIGVWNIKELSNNGYTYSNIPYSSICESTNMPYSSNLNRYSDGLVILQLSIQKTTGENFKNGDHICTLPVGYRPPGYLKHIALTYPEGVCGLHYSPNPGAGQDILTVQTNRSDISTITSTIVYKGR